MSSTTAMLDIEITIAPKKGRGCRRQSKSDERPPTAPSQIPRIARLMALAIKFRDILDCGDVPDYADLARLGHVTRARMTQIMNLLNLAPNIQEELLLRHGTLTGIGERHLRSVTSEVCWQEQGRLWHKINPPG